MSNYQDRVTTLRDMLENPNTRLTPEQRRKIYGVNGETFLDRKGNVINEPRHIDKVTIDGNVFTDYGAFSFLREKSYVKSPVRSGDGTIGNLNSYATFLTPHLKIDFGLMSIDSYRVLMNLIYEKNEFIVTCYDVVNNRDTTNKMYFTTEEMPKLWTIVEALNGNENAIELLGVQDYTVEMVGTNASFDTVEILYYDNNGNLIPEATQTVDKGTEAIINYDFVAPVGYRFDGQWKNEQGSIVRNGDAITVNEDRKLYVQLVPTNEYDLSFSYGNGNILYSQTTGIVNSVKIKKGQTISQAIANAKITLENGADFTFPTDGTGSKSVVFDGKTYTPYEFKGWFWTTEENYETKVFNNTTFNDNRNRTIYQIYSPKKYYVSFVSNYYGVNYGFAFDGINVEYGAYVSLPQPRRAGFTFEGWYTTSDFKDGTKFSGTMPPYSLTLYARWIKNSD